MGLDKGFIQIYTGEGKGKTTAALGLALRAVGRGLKVMMIQFLKGSAETGEIKAAGRLSPDLVIKPMGREGFLDPAGPGPEDMALAQGALEEACRVLRDRSCDVLILDEINVAVAMGLVPEEAVLDLMDGKPAGMELILTGRNAPKSLLDKADLVTTMGCTKHYFDRGQAARVGIEL
jgi:cob(I)alamin adenosyltransferase